MATNLLSSKQAAQRLGVHVDTLRRWARTGVIRSYRTPSGHRRFDIADIEALYTEDAP